MTTTKTIVQHQSYYVTSRSTQLFWSPVTRLGPQNAIMTPKGVCTIVVGEVSYLPRSEGNPAGCHSLLSAGSEELLMTTPLKNNSDLSLLIRER